MDRAHSISYDFESDLNVTILGHIFEQSISDLERFKAELNGYQREDMSRRKNEGLFYTPSYSTRFIVEETIGRSLKERPHLLENITILDPACGSGAFLSQAHSFLLEQYTSRFEKEMEIKQEQGEELTLFDFNPAENDRSILLNNLFGVDINEESAQITKLALWLKTAKQTESLQNLDENIKCGHSLIHDLQIVGSKAFQWDKEFEEIMAKGGFDVVIGNPPYGVQLQNEEKDYLRNWDRNDPDYEVYMYFLSKGLDLLKEGGILGFIIPNTFLSIVYGSNYRSWLLHHFQILSIVDLSEDVTFKDAAVRACIIIVKKRDCSEKALFLLWNPIIRRIEKREEFSRDFLSNHLDNWLSLFRYAQEKSSLIGKIKR